jgi:hypothetical protein
LRARKIFRCIGRKFSLSLNDWDDSIKRVTTEASKKNMPLIHPMIGEEGGSKWPHEIFKMVGDMKSLQFLIFRPLSYLDFTANRIWPAPEKWEIPILFLN